MTEVQYSSSDWGDFDGDGDLDLVITGRVDYDSAKTTTKIYENDGVGNFTTSTELTPVEQGTSDWGDFDGDGDLDLLITGDYFNAKIYMNDGAGGFKTRNAGLTGVYNSSADWGDFDGDGDLDIVITGEILDENTQTFTPHINIYENKGWVGGAFKAFNEGLTPVRVGSSEWGDIDGDGDLDLLITGEGSANIYENDGSGSFSDLNAGLTKVDLSSSNFGDYDGDGDLDIVITGAIQHFNGGYTYTPTAKIYENNGSGGFTDIDADLDRVRYSSSEWGDMDGDGDLDLVITGRDSTNKPSAIIYENDGSGGFTALNAGLTGVEWGSSNWVDIDGDGDLDLLITGLDESDKPTSKIYVNETTVGIDDQTEAIPEDFTLNQNYPNPFNPSTTIEYSIPKSTEVRIAVYNMMGKEITTLVSQQQSAGFHSVMFNATRISSGMYFYRIEAGDFIQTKKLILIK